MISTSEQTDKVFPAMIAAQSEMGKVAKGGRNTHDNYNYATLEDYIEVSSPILATHELAVVTGAEHVCSPSAQVERQTANGKPQYGTYVKMWLRLIHSSGQWIEVTACGEGQDRADKSTYKALTGARKYGIAMLLGLVTTDDPESDSNVGIDDDIL